jgi:hypothetical protein
MQQPITPHSASSTIRRSAETARGADPVRARMAVGSAGRIGSAEAAGGADQVRIPMASGAATRMESVETADQVRIRSGVAQRWWRGWQAHAAAFVRGGGLR